MEDVPQALTIEPGEWNEDAKRLIPRAHRAESVDDVRQQVETGRARIFYVKAGGQVVGAFVLRVDQLCNGAEGVIVSGVADMPGVDLVEACMPAIEALFINVQTIRYHTMRAALARKLGRMGYAPAEIICRKQVGNASIQ
jgi:hypothetical protein